LSLIALPIGRCHHVEDLDMGFAVLEEEMHAKHESMSRAFTYKVERFGTRIRMSTPLGKFGRIPGELDEIRVDAIKIRDGNVPG
jgi:hypothetical protein